MRGKHLDSSFKASRDGITPADAGKTPYRGSRHQADGDHPRGCGENAITLIMSLGQAGSPPRMRGKPEAVAKLRRDTGITPADAGKT